MSKHRTTNLESSREKEIIVKLYEAVGLLKSKQEIVDFFKDLLTDSEAIMLARRLEIAKMILAQKTFYEIREELGAGFDTINSVKRWLDYGHKGYKKVIERFE